MKIYIASDLKNPASGKGFFCQRLAAALTKLHVKIVPNAQDKHDIALQLIKIKHRTKAPQVLRLDGIYHNSTMNFKKSNKPLITHMQAADGIIYQSKFSKEMCNRYLGKPKKLNATIFNGNSPLNYTSATAAASPFKVNFFTASRWRPHKRLIDTIESFLLTNIPNSCLWVAGDLSKSGLSKLQIKTYTQKNIRFLGRIDQASLAKYYKLCNAFIHLCWLDWCPNSVVEAITAGCTVICGNQGGTAELVAPSGGIVCNIDKAYNQKPCQLYSPPKIDRHLVADAMMTSIKTRIINNDHVNIDNVASQYLEFFKTVCGRSC